MSQPEEIKEFDPELVINAVTIKHTLEAFNNVMPFLSKNCILSDIASVKTGLPEFYQNCGFRFVSSHPMVARLQSVISEEMQKQLLEHEGRDYPDYILACVGGGSNAAGAFYHYLHNDKVQLIEAEAAGKGIDTPYSAATIHLGREGIIHGCRTLIMQSEDGQIEEPYSISAGLDYPGIGPIHAHHDTGPTKVFGFWIYLMSDCILFCCLFATYAVLVNGTAGGPTGKDIFELPFVLVETALLLFSSITYGMSPAG